MQDAEGSLSLLFGFQLELCWVQACISIWEEKVFALHVHATILMLIVPFPEFFITIPVLFGLLLSFPTSSSPLLYAQQ